MLINLQRKIKQFLKKTNTRIDSRFKKVRKFVKLEFKNGNVYV